MKDKVCISCNNKLKFLGKNHNWDIFQCLSCGLGVTVGEFPQTPYSAYHRDPVYIKEKDQFKNIFQKRVGVIGKFKNPGRVLEVGSSTGLFLSLLKNKGWEVQGVEPSKTSTQEALKNNILTNNFTFEEAQIPSQSYDLVIFNHVLEHMDDPVNVLQKANSVLKKDGLILIDVPNFGSLSAKLRGANWQYILPKEHRWHFTPKSLITLLAKTGFQTVHWETHSGIWGYGNPLREVWESLMGGKKRFIWNILTAIPSWILTKFNAGSGLTVVAQKI